MIARRILLVGVVAFSCNAAASSAGAGPDRAAPPPVDGAPLPSLADLGIAVAWRNAPAEHDGARHLLVGTRLRFDVTRKRRDGPPVVVKLTRKRANGAKVVVGRHEVETGPVRFTLRDPGLHIVSMKARESRRSGFGFLAFRRDYPARVKLTPGRAYRGWQGVSTTVENVGPWRYERGSLSVFQLQTTGWTRLAQAPSLGIPAPTVMQYIEPGAAETLSARLAEPLTPGRYRIEWFGRPASGPEFEQTPSVEFGVGTQDDPCSSPGGCPVPGSWVELEPTNRGPLAG